MVKADGTIMQGNTRIKVLEERGYPVNELGNAMNPSDNDYFKRVGGPRWLGVDSLIETIIESSTIRGALQP